MGATDIAQDRRKAYRAKVRCISAEEMLVDIRLKCLDCCCGSRKMVQDCKTPDCRLYKYRNVQALEQTEMFGKTEQLHGQIDMFGLEAQ